MNDPAYSPEKGGSEDVKKVLENKPSYTSDMVEKEKLDEELRSFISEMTSNNKTD